MSIQKNILVLLFVVLLWGCEEQPVVVVYTALDRNFSEPILREFERRTGIAVKAKYDAENTKTVGLTASIIEERDAPRCDVFWNNEILNTLRLQKEGILASYYSPSASDIPQNYRDREGYWTGFAARARVLLINTDLVSLEEAPRSIYGLTDPRWRGRCGMARPIAGTTASHVACLFAYLGAEKAEELLLKLRENQISLESGNKSCARKVAAGELAMALTDTDDAMIEILEGQPVAIVYLDSTAEEIGTLFIPNSLSMIKNSPNPQGAKKLIDFLLSAEVESMLSRCPSKQIPLNPKVKKELPEQIKTPGEIKAMAVDFSEAAAMWEQSRDFVVRDFLRQN